MSPGYQEEQASNQASKHLLNTARVSEASKQAIGFAIWQPGPANLACSAVVVLVLHRRQRSQGSEGLREGPPGEVRWASSGVTGIDGRDRV